MGNTGSNEEYPESDIRRYYGHNNQQQQQHTQQQHHIITPSTSSSHSSFQQQHYIRERERERGEKDFKASSSRPPLNNNNNNNNNNHTQHHTNSSNSNSHPLSLQHHRLQNRFYSPTVNNHQRGERDRDRDRDRRERGSHLPDDATSVSSLEGSGGTSTGDGRRRRPNTMLKQPRLIGPYVLLDDEPLGSGGSATVELAVLQETGEMVALKLIPRASVLNDPLFFKQVKQELECFNQLRHPHIIRLRHWEPHVLHPLETGEQVPSVMLVMELAMGGSLEDYLAFTGPFLNEYIARTVFHQIMDALNYCHSLAVFHRDLKPDNILFDQESRVKIVDFGLAKIHDGRNISHTNCGTDGYRAPEVVNVTVKYLDKADMWSAGVVLFRIVVGFLPFTTCDHNDRRWREVCEENWDDFWDYWEGKTSPYTFTAEFKHLASCLLQRTPEFRLSALQALSHPWLTGLNAAPQVAVKHEMAARAALMRRNQPLYRSDYWSDSSEEFEAVRALPNTPMSVFLIPPEMENFFSSPSSSSSSASSSTRSKRGDSYGYGDNKVLGKLFSHTHTHTQNQRDEKNNDQNNSGDNDNSGNNGNGDGQKRLRPPSLSPGHPLGLMSILTNKEPEVVIDTIENELNNRNLNQKYSHFDPWKFRATFITNLGTTDLSISVVSVEDGNHAILFTRRSGPDSAYRSAFAELFYRLSKHLSPPPPTTTTTSSDEH